MNPDGDNRLGAAEAADAAAALARLRELGAGESLAAVVERFARKRSLALARAARSGRRPAAEPEFLFPDTVRSLMREFGHRPGAPEDAVGIQLAVGFFAGLTGVETRMIRWCDLDLEKAVLAVRRRAGSGEILDRMVNLEPNAVLWLSKTASWLKWKSGRHLPPGPIVRRGGGLAEWLRVAMLGRDAEWSEAEFRALMRNTYATMHLAAFGDASSTAASLGHRHAGDLLVRHYGGLVPKGVAESYWTIVPERGRLPPTPFERREEDRLVARSAWEERRLAEEGTGAASERAIPTAALVRRFFQIAERNPGTIEASPGAAMALGFFAGVRNVDLSRLLWKDFDPGRGTLLMPLSNQDRIGPGKPERLSVTLRETAVLWLLRWRRWAEAGGATPESPIVPMYRRFRSWAERFLLRSGLMRSMPVDLMAKTHRAMKYARLEDGRADASRAEVSDEEREAFWSILPPRRVRPSLPKSRPRRVLRRAAPGAERRAISHTKPLPAATVRRIFDCTCDNPGPREAAIGATLTLGFLAGLHTSEIHKAKWEDVDWAHGLVTIPEPEGHSDIRADAVVELSPAALDWLRRWHVWASAPDGTPPSGLVVPHYWRFMRWRRAETRLKRLRWASDLMRVTYEARKDDPAYARIRCRAVLAPPAELLGRGFRADLRCRAPDFVGPPDLRKHNPRWRILPTEAVERAFRAAEAHPGDVRCAPGAFMTLGFLVGLRTSEIARARWEDVRWDEAAMVVPRPRTYAKCAPVPKVLPLRPNALAWLRRWVEWAAPAGAGAAIACGPIAPSPWRFLEWKKRHLDGGGDVWGARGQHDVMRLTCETMARAAGLPDAPPEAQDTRPASELTTPEEARAFWSFLPSPEPYPPPLALKWNPKRKPRLS